MQPKFLSKKEREKIALEKRAQEVEADRRAKERATSSEVSRNGTPYEGAGAPIPTGPRAMRNAPPNKGYDMSPPAADRKSVV